MDENEAVEEQQLATPIFNVYRRGYDPEQVDRYVADQQRRLDDALRRASVSERRLAAAVGQLRELHRRVAVYESETRTVQPPALDTLGERVQRILQEAWEGAYSLRQEAEREVTELRETVADEVTELRAAANREATDVVDQATRRALAIRDETERRRHAYLQRVEQDRERAVSQITYLYDQRQSAIAELARLQTTVQAVVEEMVRSPLGRPAPGVAAAAAAPPVTDDSPTLAREDDTRPRPDRLLGRPSSPLPAGPPDQPVSVPYRGGEGSGRHGAPAREDFSPEHERRDATEAGDERTRAEARPTSEQLRSPARRSGSLFNEDAPEEEVPEATRSGRRRTGLFDAEQEGWT